MNQFEGMSREDLLKALEMFAKNWLVHDGCWFLAAERQHGLETAIRLDSDAWAQFAAVEARRIMTTFGLPADGGLDALEKALELRMYSLVNRQHSERQNGRLLFYMDICRVQEARRRKDLPDFPCKEVGVVEFSTFARTIDPRISTACLHCPPDAAEGRYCGWEFTLNEDREAKVVDEPPSLERAGDESPVLAWLQGSFAPYKKPPPLMEAKTREEYCEGNPFGVSGMSLFLLVNE